MMNGEDDGNLISKRDGMSRNDVQPCALGDHLFLEKDKVARHSMPLHLPSDQWLCPVLGGLGPICMVQNRQPHMYFSQTNSLT